MKRISKFLVLSCIMLTIFIFDKTMVLASESNTPCEISITIKDMFEEFKGEVNVTIVTTGKTIEKTLTEKNWKESMIETVYSEDYGVASVYATVQEKGWQVVDGETLKGLEEFEITNGVNHTLSLMIIPTKDNEKYGDTVDTLATTSTIVTDVLETYNLTNGDSDVVSNGVDIDSESAEEVYQNFLSVTEIMKNDSTWDNTLNNMYGGIAKSTYKNVYLDTVMGATEEKWENMSNYDVFIYIETYLRYSSMVKAESTTNYFERGEDGIASLEKNVIGVFNGTDSEKIIEAYDSIVRWQADYWQEYKFPYNMITKRSYADETGIAIVEDTEEEIADFTEEEIAEIRENSLITKEKSLWDNVLKRIFGQWLSILIFAILFIAFLIVRYIRKKRSIDEMTDDGR